MDTEPVIPEPSQWWQRAERARREKERRLRKDAVGRLRRIEAFARERLAAGPARSKDLPIVLDSERFAAPFLERIGIRGRVQLLLWSGFAAVGACTIFSFFTAPLMELGTATSAILVATMLILSYVM
jgi:hypothetical protein